MALPFFYESGLSPGTSSFTLSEETSKHCIQVLRMRAGEQMHLTDGKGNMFTAVIFSTDKKHSTVNIINSTFTQQKQRKVCIGISLLKNTSRFEWFLEKATEIGVSEIVPLICHRTERQQFRYSRMHHILIAAMLQSQQTWLPVLHQPSEFKNVLSFDEHHQKFIAHCIEEEKQQFSDISVDRDVLVLIGPEGDFTPEEVQSALQNNFQPVSLGSTRLRTETAGVVAATLFMNL